MGKRENVAETLEIFDVSLNVPPFPPPLLVETVAGSKLSFREAKKMFLRLRGLRNTVCFPVWISASVKLFLRMFSPGNHVTKRIGLGYMHCAVYTIACSSRVIVILRNRIHQIWFDWLWKPHVLGPLPFCSSRSTS